MPVHCATMTSWPFAADERRTLLRAYDALTRVGNVTRDTETDRWDPILDRAQHDLGLLLAKLAIDDGEDDA